MYKKRETECKMMRQMNEKECYERKKVLVYARENRVERQIMVTQYRHWRRVFLQSQQIIRLIGYTQSQCQGHERYLSFSRDYRS